MEEAWAKIDRKIDKTWKFEIFEKMKFSFCNDFIINFFYVNYVTDF